MGGGEGAGPGPRAGGARGSSRGGGRGRGGQRQGSRGGGPGGGAAAAIIRQGLFSPEGINWLSITYRVEADIDAEKIVPKDDEIEEARWFSKEGALQVAVSFFDIEAIQKHI